MDFRRKNRQRIERKPEFENLESKYPHNVSLYNLPPLDDIKIQEFEDLSLERLRVLRILDLANSKGLRFLSDEWKEFVNGELAQEGLKGYLRLCTTGTCSNASDSKREFDLQARRKDYISHFILRLVYCRSDDLHRWFLTRELELFKYKFSTLTSSEIKHFLEINKLNYSPLTDEQKNEVKDGLYESTTGQSVTKVELLDFYKVYFTQVLDLVRSRRCYLKDGYAYVNSQDFISIISVLFINEVEHGLNSARRLINEVETDERLFHLLKSLHTTYTGKNYTVNREAGVPIESLDQLSKKSYPLCMRACHEHLRTAHHLKHYGRMQYGLFLKGIGVTLEDSIRFWREEFTKKIDPDTFVKKYEYNIYHNYGKKGSMINYTPYSCLKIIQDNVAAGDVHGCPYKLLDQSVLKAKLLANGLAATHVQDIMTYVAKKHYQLACGKYFQFTHETQYELAINHPNQYFEESQIILANCDVKSKGVDSTVKKTAKRKPYETNNLLNADDDDELWNIAEEHESTLATETQEKETWDDDLDLATLTY